MQKSLQDVIKQELKFEIQIQEFWLRNHALFQTETKTDSYNISDLDMSQYFDYNFHYRSPYRVIQVAMQR